MKPLTAEERAEIARRTERQKEIEREVDKLDPAKDAAKIKTLMSEWEMHEYICEAL